MTDTRINSTVREFTQDDWDGFSGCQTFANGDQPLIADSVIDGKECTIVGCAETIGVYYYVEDENLMTDTYWYSLFYASDSKIGVPRVMVQAMMEKILREVKSFNDLTELGFERS